jgi:phospholipid/cholesterol/gamma-HCH transport system permease protein
MIVTFEHQHQEPPKGILQATGRRLLRNVRAAGKALLILLEAFMWFVHVPRRMRTIFQQLFTVGIASFGVISTVALFTGMILSLQAGLILADYGQEVNVGTLTSQTMCREMGPFMTALILAASVGASMAASIGTMRVSEEIDALEVMSVNPVDYLVMPRLIALMIMCPILTIYTNCIGVVGGGIVANTQLNISWSAYYYNAISTLKLKAIYVGLLKAFAFGIVIATVACYQGLATTNGAIGVGRATRKSVVTNFLLVLIIGYFITRIFY